MNTRALLAAAITPGPIGVALLILDQVPAVAGAIVGVSAASIPAVLLLRRAQSRLAEHAADLHERTAELQQRREQYDAAYATLASQRERLRAGLQLHLVQQRAELESTHRQELLEAQARAYLQGVAHALGDEAEAPVPTTARVIDLADRRPAPMLVDQT